MTDTITLQQAAQIALDAMEDFRTKVHEGRANSTDSYYKFTLAVKTLRAALAQQAEPVPEELHGCACRWDADDNRVSTCVRHQGWLDVVQEWSERAKAAEAPQVAQQAEQGCVRVPVEPTQEMITAGRTTPMPSDSEFDEDEDYRAVFIAMVAAAPKGGV